MKDVALENIKPGMRLAKDVYDRNGRLILASGTEIAETHLRTFKVWRVTSICVEAAASNEGAGFADTMNPAVKKRLEVRFKQLFQNADVSHPFMQRLYEFAFNRSLRFKLRPGGKE